MAVPPEPFISLSTILECNTQENFSTKIPLSLWSGSWNINGTLPPESIEKWIGDANSQKDIYVFNIQEFVPLNILTLIFRYGVQKRIDIWNKNILMTLNKDPNVEYSNLIMQSSGGLCLLIYVKTSLIDQIHDLCIFKVNTGPFGFPNKGILGISFNIYNTSLCICNQHAKPHQKGYNKRCKDFQYLNTYKLPNGLFIKDHDIIIWSGDLNSHLQFPKECKNNRGKLLIEDKNNEENSVIVDSSKLLYSRLFQFSYHELTSLLPSYIWEYYFTYDEIYQSQINGKVYFKGFMESRATFPPTFKFKPLTDQYILKKGKKEKPPAWCDRILYSTLVPLSIASSSPLLSLPFSRQSDHLPVSSVISIYAYQYNQSNMQSLLFSIPNNNHYFHIAALKV
ncbi:hypothetical protein WA158_004093 [Blastocystis sp. Blastoise]